eukprot:TRINITY_DN14394_c0_g5_i1.p1 TRINITY_DN14394_c0_g5~~TRINITY_DN14394_c0_g5_i1.p1  ORF type:complete len:369 (-),score=67.62 TRINITY_DN14394_c0_g5_i1:185-1291(-)
MADADVDIYGDLFDEPAFSPAPATSPLALPPPSPANAGATASGGGSGGSMPPPSPSGAATSSGAPAAAEEAWRGGDPYSEWSFSETLVVDGGQVISGKIPNRWPSDPAHDPALDDRPADFEALSKELLEDERLPAPLPSPSPSARSAAEEGGEQVIGRNEAKAAADDDTDDEVAVELGEVRALHVGAAPARPPPRRAQANNNSAAQAASDTGIVTTKRRRREVSLFVGPPPPSTSTAGVAECYLLVGGLPWWLSDADLRRYAETFGRLRCLRVLDYTRSGKSTGIALLEYLMPDSAKQAARPSEGLAALSVWATLSPGAAAIRVKTVSRELYEKLRFGTLPWSEGGPCSDDLRAILMRQFDARAEGGT